MNPRWYAVGRNNPSTRTVTLYPIPIHKLVNWVDRVWWWVLTFRPTRRDMLFEQGRVEGVAEMQNTLRDRLRRLREHDRATKGMEEFFEWANRV